MRELDNHMVLPCHGPEDDEPWQRYEENPDDFYDQWREEDNDDKV